MKPGRELDKLIAEKVMGLTFDRSRTSDGPNYFDPPNYSENMEAAWDVADRITKLGFEVRLFAYSGGEVHCEIEKHPEKYFSSGPADTAPHAICLAALKAFGVEF